MLFNALIVEVSLKFPIVAMAEILLEHSSLAIVVLVATKLPIEDLTIFAEVITELMRLLEDIILFAIVAFRASKFPDEHVFILANVKLPTLDTTRDVVD